MSVAVVYNGVTYGLPTEGEVNWAAALTSFLQALSGNTMTVSGEQTLTNKTLTAPVLTTATASSTSGAAITATTTGTNATALLGTGNGSGSGVQGTGGGTDGTGVKGIGGATNGRGMLGVGTGTGSGVVGQSGASGGYGVWGDVPSGSGSAGVRGTGGSTSAAGVEAVGGTAAGTGLYAYTATGTGYAVIAEADTTSPVRSALRLVPQNANPTGPNLVGDIYCSTAGVLKVCVVAGTPGTWADVGATQTGALTVTGAFVVQGNTQLGDAIGDGVTINAGTVAIPNGLAVDTDLLVLDAANNRLGVNKAVPTVALDVVGAITSTGTVTGVAGTFSGALSGATGAITGNLTVDTDVLSVDASNNRVGVNKASPSVALDVVGVTNITQSAAAIALDVTQTGSGTIAIRGTGNGSSVGVRGVGGTTGAGGSFAGGATSGQGVIGVGGGASAGGFFTGGATDGIGCDAGGGGSNGIGVKGTGVGTGHGVWANHAGGGYALYISGDLTSPAKGAIRMVPQDAEPTGSNAVGDLYMTTAGVLKVCTSAGSPGTWVSVGAQT